MQPNRARWAVMLSCALLAGCDDIQQSPKLIDADGQTYVACSGLVWVNLEGGGLFGGGGTFKVTFTDGAGLSHTLRGLKKIEVSDLPPTPPARQLRAGGSANLSLEDQRLLALYNAGSTPEERARAAEGMTESERKQLVQAFIIKYGESPPATTPPNPCAVSR